MNKETNSIKWMEELAKADDEVCQRIAKEIEDSPLDLRTYNAVVGFVPNAFVPTPRNVPVSSLLKLYATKGSGRRREARLLLKQRFEYLDYSVQKKIVWLFLDGSKQDRLFCYVHLKQTWDKAFDAKIIEQWEAFHEPECAMLVVRSCNIDYVRSNSEELAKSVGYFEVCKRLCTEDKSYAIDLNQLAGPHEYVRVLYEAHRRVDSDEAMQILWRTIENALLQCICNDGDDHIIADYFVISISYAEATDRSNETFSPSVGWRPQVMECMRYLYRTAPRSIVAEAINWDMQVRRLFRSLTKGLRGHEFVGLPHEDQRVAGAMREIKAFCKLAYAMFPKDKKELVADGRHREVGLESWYDGSGKMAGGISGRRHYADMAVEGLLETIKEFRLCESMTPEEWQAFYKEKIEAQYAFPFVLMANGEFGLVCPARGEFIEKLLY